MRPARRPPAKWEKLELCGLVNDGDSPGVGLEALLRFCRVGSPKWVSLLPACASTGDVVLAPRSLCLAASDT